MAHLSVPPGFYSYSKLKVLHYGPGSVSKLPETLKSLGTTRALILTGKSVSKSPVFEDTSKALGLAHVASFTDIGQHTPVAGIKNALKILEETNADAIVALGGGSPVDAAKAISYYRRQEKGESVGFLKIVAVPTTLSAAEYTMNAGYTNEDGHKVSVNDPELCPDAVILDTDLTLHTPERLWLSTGVRALDHAVEALYRSPPTPFPIVESSLSAIPLLFENLLACKKDPSNIDVRYKLQLASYLSLAPNPKPGALGLSHSLGHKLGATYQIPHGITSCLTLAKAVELSAKTTDKYSKKNLERAVKRLEAEVEGLPKPAEKAEGGVLLAAYISALVKELGLATTLEEWKVPKTDLEGIAKMMEKGKLAGGNNQPTVAQIHELLSSI
ncbi:iron containing alcohol dehydrogenase family protein [Ceratobasidium sp. AG-Ba]|nr:iron containing alcohol dehydrogenase family protein [Ceratobasidium sp. AG-Ba]